MLQTRFPRIPGDVGNPRTFDFPVLYEVVPGASPDRVVRRCAEGLLEPFLEAATKLVARGAAGIVGNCGFLSLFQEQLAARCGVPVASSALMQAPLIERLLPPGRRVGILTICAASLTPAHLEAAGVAPDVPIAGTEGGREFSRVILNDLPEMDVAEAARDVLSAGAALVECHPEVGALLFECTNMCPFARDLSRRLGLPVFDMVSFVTWFHGGLVPRRWPAE
jgi:Asp/Glu/hydantoin racemase